MGPLYQKAPSWDLPSFSSDVGGPRFDSSGRSSFCFRSFRRRHNWQKRCDGKLGDDSDYVTMCPSLLCTALSLNLLLADHLLKLRITLHHPSPITWSTRHMPHTPHTHTHTPHHCRSEAHACCSLLATCPLGTWAGSTSACDGCRVIGCGCRENICTPRWANSIKTWSLWSTM